MNWVYFDLHGLFSRARTLTRKWRTLAVREMVHVAAGHPLSLTQDDVGINGWAVESRV